MTGILPCASYESVDLMEKTELTEYEQYLKDYAEQIVRAYTPEKYFPQKEMEFVLDVQYFIQPDGSITDLWVSNHSEHWASGDPFWFLRPVYYMRLTRLSREYEQYVKKIVLQSKPKPFSEEFASKILVGFELRHWNAWFKKPEFNTMFECHDYGFFKEENMMSIGANIFRSNDKNKFPYGGYWKYK